MRLLIVGVGQTLNFETKEMEDTLQVQTPHGVINVPTTNEAAQALVQMAMNGHGSSDEQYQTETKAFTPETEQYRQQPVVARPEELTGRVEDRFEGHPDAGDFPEGASLFGGDVSEAPEPEEPMGLAEGVDEQVQQKIFAKTQRTSPTTQKLGLRRNPADRSGVPSLGISRVDEKGNPILPPPPDQTMDDEEDPGEQI